MTRQLRVIAIVVFILAIGGGTASAYNKDDKHSVIINLDGVPRMVSTEKDTVGELMASIDDLMEAEYILEDVKEESELTGNMVINLTSITEKTNIKTEVIPFQTETKDTAALNLGTERVVQEGVNGEVSITTKESYAGDDLVSSEVLEKKEVKKVQNKIVERGTMNPNAIDGYSYAYALNVKATGYTPYDAGCNGITATGRQATKGVVAVDPRIIPLGTKLYIPGYGQAIAADTGGAIKGNKIDLCYNSKNEAFGWGVRNVTVYVLK